MQSVRDPVCGTIIEPTGAVQRIYNGHEYYFCSTSCSRAFQADPAYFTEQRDPPYTVSHRMVSPRFGSAGSGGLENEPAE